jgi:hypothetical protein
MRRGADLHVRTTASRGELTPAEVVQLAEKRRLKAIAIVEHETLAGIPEAIGLARSHGVEVIPGVELVYEEGMRNVHIIGYFIDWHNRRLRSEVSKAQAVRISRINDILSKLRALRIEIPYEELLREAEGSNAIARAHIASYMVRMRMVGSMREAFDRYFGPGRPAFVPRDKYPLPILLDWIHKAGGIAALAHPKFGEAERFIPLLVREGLKALEVYHPAHTSQEILHFKRVAKKYGLVEVGGTDSGAEGVGQIRVPYTTVRKLKNLLRRRWSAELSNELFRKGKVD